MAAVLMLINAEPAYLALKVECSKKTVIKDCRLPKYMFQNASVYYTMYKKISSRYFYIRWMGGLST